MHIYTGTRSSTVPSLHLLRVSLAHSILLHQTPLLLHPNTHTKANMAADKQFSDSFTFLPQGGIIQEFKVAGTNVVLGFPSAESYRTKHNPFFGENIGRVANRISGAKINSLNGKSYDLAVNNGPNTLHGGAVGWGKKDFEGPTPVNRNGKESVMFKYLSKDGEEGFPGTVEMRLWYMPSIEKVDGVEKTSLEIEYEAELVGDEVEETVIALTNHRCVFMSARRS
jgi:aldose 1-epimerase